MSCGVRRRRSLDLRDCGCGVGQWLQLRFDPSLGTSICRGCSPKKETKQNKDSALSIREGWGLGSKGQQGEGLEKDREALFRLRSEKASEEMRLE